MIYLFLFADSSEEASMIVQSDAHRVCQPRLLFYSFAGKWIGSALIVLLAALWFFPSHALAAERRLAPPLAESGVISTFSITPNGKDVIYIADQDVEGVDELYRASVAGGTPVKLNAPLVADGDVQSFLISR